MGKLPLKRTADKAASPSHTPSKRLRTSAAEQEAVSVASPSPPNTPFRLLALPAELRNHIYSYVMSGKTISLSSGSVLDADTDPFALAHTNCQLRSETSALVFTSNSFLLASHFLNAYPAQVGPNVPFLPQQLAQMRTIVFDVGENCRWARGVSFRLIHLGKALFSGVYPGLREVVVMGGQDQLDMFEKFAKMRGYAGWDAWAQTHEEEGFKLVKRVAG
jgi:hypothetical protein